MLAGLGVAEASAGRLRHSEDAISRASALLAAHPGLSAPVLLDVAIARCAYMQTDLTTMGQALQRVTASGALQTDPRLAANVAFIRANYLIAVGDLNKAQAALENDPVLTAHGGLLTVYRDAELATIETLLGRPHAALRRLEPYRRTRYLTAVGVAAARAHLALGQCRAADSWVREVISASSVHANRVLFIDALLCDAQIALAEGADSRAVEALDHAVELADVKITIPFARAGDTFAPLLARHPMLAARWPRQVPVPADPPPELMSPPDDGLFQALTERERTILRFLAANMSASEIADDLYVSVNTVKTHVSSIYRKLSVRGRREAVRQAHRLELL